MLYEIKNRWSGEVIYVLDCDSMRLCVEVAVEQEVSLSGANLSGANLSYADLGGANLGGANLRCANLSGANLSGANLSGANLRYADLGGANLGGANLRCANLSGANLSGANLSGANLRYADLSGANLSGANLRQIRDDLWAVLSSSPHEVRGLRQTIVEGRIDGSCYEGQCACLVGTLAKEKGCRYDAIPGLLPDSERPIERFFSAIKPGDTPETNQFSNLAVEWIDAWPPLALVPVASEAVTEEQPQ